MRGWWECLYFDLYCLLCSGDLHDVSAVCKINVAPQGGVQLLLQILDIRASAIAHRYVYTQCAMMIHGPAGYVIYACI